MCFFARKWNQIYLPKICASLKKLDNGQSSKEEDSVNSNYAIFSLLDFFTLEVGTDMLSRNIGKELPTYCE